MRVSSGEESVNQTCDVVINIRAKQEQRDLIDLDEEKFRQFEALLDASPARNEKLHTLLTTKAPWD